MITNTLHLLGYKMTFFYEDNKLDAVCIAKWEGADLNLKATYNVEQITEILFEHFKTNGLAE